MTMPPAMLLSQPAKRILWQRWSERLGWADLERDEREVRAEIEETFGPPPYEFLTPEDAGPRFAYFFRERRTRNPILDPDYAALRPGPNYGHFAGHMTDGLGREYRFQSESDYEVTLAYRRPIRLRAKFDAGNGGEGHPSAGDDLVLVHGEACPGHACTVVSTRILPRAATGVVTVTTPTNGSVSEATCPNRR